MGKYLDHHFFICECQSLEHQFIFSCDKGEVPNDTFIYLAVHLVKKSFWYRLKYGIKYIFGRKSRFGAFDEIIIDPLDADRFQIIVNKMKQLQILNKEHE